MTVDQCSECGRVREILARSMCRACYSADYKIRNGRTLERARAQVKRAEERLAKAKARLAAVEAQQPAKDEPPPWVERIDRTGLPAHLREAAQ